MEARTLEALKESIAHHERAYANPLEEELGPENCHLCQLFFRDLNRDHTQEKDPNCVGCPIFESTGKRYCESTPYMAAAELAEELVEEQKYYGEQDPLRLERFRLAEFNEIQFLKSLLPKENQEPKPNETQ